MENIEDGVDESSEGSSSPSRSWLDTFDTQTRIFHNFVD